MTDQLPVPVSRKTAIATKRTTPQIVVPALIADLGEQSSWRYTEFFSANISNPNTRRAYARACLRFLSLVRRARPDADGEYGRTMMSRHTSRKTWPARRLQM